MSGIYVGYTGIYQYLFLDTYDGWVLVHHSETQKLQTYQLSLWHTQLIKSVSCDEEYHETPETSSQVEQEKSWK